MQTPSAWRQPRFSTSQEDTLRHLEARQLTDAERRAVETMRTNAAIAAARREGNGT